MAEARTPGIISVLRRTARLMVHELVVGLDAAGYTDVQPAFHPVFECIDEGGTRLTDLAARADMTHQSMSEVVAALERRGYVERRPDPSDGRARLVCLTREGTELRRVGSALIRDIERSWQTRWRHRGLDADVRHVMFATLAEAETGARKGFSRGDDYGLVGIGIDRGEVTRRQAAQGGSGEARRPGPDTV